MSVPLWIAHVSVNGRYLKFTSTALVRVFYIFYFVEFCSNFPGNKCANTVQTLNLCDRAIWRKSGGSTLGFLSDLNLIDWLGLITISTMIIFKFAWYLRGTNLMLWTPKYTDSCLIWGLTKQKFWPLSSAYLNRLTNQIRKETKKLDNSISDRDNDSLGPKPALCLLIIGPKIFACKRSLNTGVDLNTTSPVYTSHSPNTYLHFLTWNQEL